MMNIEPNLTHQLINSFSDIQFVDLFEIEKIQDLQDLYAYTHKVASNNTNSNKIFISDTGNFTRLYKNIIQSKEKDYSKCFKSDVIIDRYNPSVPIVQPFLSSDLKDTGSALLLIKNTLLIGLSGK